MSFGILAILVGKSDIRQVWFILQILEQSASEEMFSFLVFSYFNL